MGNKLIKNTFIYALGEIIPKLLSFITFPILTNYLSPDEYGILNYVNTINYLLTIVGLLCLNTFFLVYYYKQENEIQQKKLLGNLSFFIFLVNTLFVGLLFIIGPNCLKYIGSNVNFYPYIAIGLVTYYFELFSILPSALYRLKENPLPLTILNILKGSIMLCLTLLLILKFNFKAEGVLVANMIVAIIFGLTFLRITFANMILNFNWEQLKFALKFSLPLLPGSISYYCVSLFDRVLIDKYVGLKELGIYSTASSLAFLLNIISNAAYKAFEPYFFKIYGTDGFRRGFDTVNNIFCFILLCGVLGLSLFSREFYILLSSEQFYSAYIYVPLILIGIMFSSMSLLYGTIITARGRTKYNSIIALIGGVLSLALNFFLLPRIGILGATISSAVSTLTMLLMSRFYSNIRVRNNKILCSIIVAAVFIYIGVYTIDIDNVVHSLAVKVIIYLICLFIIMNIFNINTLRTGLKQLS